MRRVSFPHTFYLDDADSPADVIDAMALAEFAEGAQPFARTVRLERVRADALMLPAEATVRRAAKDEGSSSHLAAGEGWTLRAVRYRGGSAVVTVTATTADLARTVIEESTKDVQEVQEAPNDAVDIAFTHLTLHGPRRAIRNISTTPWAELRANYAGAVQSRFDDLMALTPENLSAGFCCCTDRPAPARPPPCAAWRGSGGSGARSTASSIPRHCSAPRRT